MKVAFPTNNGEKIARHASLCKSFLIVDTATGDSMTLSNPLKDEKIIPHQGEHEGEKLHRGTGRIVPQLLAGQGVTHYICLEAGEGLQSRLRSAGIAVSVVSEKQIGEVLEQLENLQPARWSAEAPLGMGRGYGGRREEAGRRGGRRGSERGCHDHEGRGHGCGDGHGHVSGHGRHAHCRH